MDDRSDHVQALARALFAGDLWSLVEAAQADAAVRALDDGLDDDAYELAWEAALAGRAAELLTPWHLERLGELVRRLRAQLPFEGYPDASGAIAAACDEFERDSALREHLAVALFADALVLVRPSWADASLREAA